MCPPMEGGHLFLLDGDTQVKPADFKLMKVHIEGQVAWVTPGDHSNRTLAVPVGSGRGSFRQ